MPAYSAPIPIPLKKTNKPTHQTLHLSAVLNTIALLSFAHYSNKHNKRLKLKQEGGLSAYNIVPMRVTHQSACQGRCLINSD